MVHFMGPSETLGITIICIPQPFKTLVDKNIVDGKVGDSVCQYPKTYRPSLPKIGPGARPEENHANYGIKDKKSVIAFKPGTVVLFMVVPVQAPQKAVHNILMRKPGHKFHKAEYS